MAGLWLRLAHIPGDRKHQHSAFLNWALLGLLLPLIPELAAGAAHVRNGIEPQANRWNYVSIQGRCLLNLLEVRRDVVEGSGVIPQPHELFADLPELIHQMPIEILSA